LRPAVSRIGRSRRVRGGLRAPGAEGAQYTQAARPRKRLEVPCAFSRKARVLYAEIEPAY